MKDWLKDKIPLPVKLGLKRKLSWISERQKTEQLDDRSTDLRRMLVDFEEERVFLRPDTAPRVHRVDRRPSSFPFSKG